jgi:undecaprenyl-diphosphatase
MPDSTSFPSGHTASAFAFAEGVGRVIPALGLPLRVAAVAVGYSRVHVGVHYPGDVAAGALIGRTAGETAPRLLKAVRRRHSAA